MSKKNLLVVVLIALLAFTVGIGTYAWFSSSVETSNQTLSTGTLLLKDWVNDIAVTGEAQLFTPGSIVKPDEAVAMTKYTVKNDGNVEALGKAELRLIITVNKGITVGPDNQEKKYIWDRVQEGISITDNGTTLPAGTLAIFDITNVADVNNYMQTQEIYRDSNATVNLYIKDKNGDPEPQDPVVIKDIFSKFKISGTDLSYMDKNGVSVTWNEVPMDLKDGEQYVDLYIFKDWLEQEKLEIANYGDSTALGTDREFKLIKESTKFEIGGNIKLDKDAGNECQNIDLQVQLRINAMQEHHD